MTGAADLEAALATRSRDSRVYVLAGYAFDDMTRRTPGASSPWDAIGAHGIFELRRDAGVSLPDEDCDAVLAHY